MGNEKIKLNIRYGYERTFFGICIKEPKSRMRCKVKDFEHFDLMCVAKKMLREYGFKIGNDKRIKTEYTLLNQYHSHGIYKGLEFKFEIYPIGFKFEFFQNVTKSEHRNGGYYEYDKYAKFPYLLKLRMKVVINKLVKMLTPLCDADITFLDDSKYAEEYLLKSYSESCHHPNVKKLSDVGPNMGEYNNKYNSKDRDGKHIQCGEVKYFYSYDGYLHRGVVYHNLNNMWWVIENDITLRNKAQFELFDRTDEPIRKVLSSTEKMERLNSELQKQIASQNFMRCVQLKKQIEKLKAEA